MSNRTRKEASSEAAWALLMEGVTAARLETHRLKILVNRSLKVVHDSEKRDHLYQVAGDIILAVPDRLQRLETVLDRTLLALAGMGEGFLSARLPFSEKQLVEEASTPAFGGGASKSSVDSVTKAYFLRKLRGQE